MISIIITVYNAEQYISRAIDSCINQTYKDFEVILIEDCSTDNSLNICENYHKKYDNISLIRNNENLGAGWSRYIGLSHAKGTHTIFLDADDYYKEDILETLINAYLESKADIIHPGLIVVDDNTFNVRVPSSKLAFGEDKFIPDEFDTKRFLNTMLIKRELWDKVEYSKRRYIEDTPTLFKLLYYANAVHSIEYAGYYYVQNPKSICHTVSNFKKKLYLCLAAKDNIEFIKDKIPNSLNYNHFINKFEELQEGDFNENEFYNYPEESVEILSYLYKCLKY